MKTKNFNLKTTTKTLIVAGVIAGVSLPVTAKKYRDHSNVAFDYAKVIEVSPVVETYQVNNPVEQCWDERVPVKAYYPERRHKSHTGEIFGALIGAAVGNQVGSGRGKKVATAAGALLGGSIARDIKHNKRRYDGRYYEPTRYETVERCEIRESVSTEERIVGYDVTYKYRGNVFNTQMDRAPGNKIKVKVIVKPV